MPKVSVIIATYNRAKFISESIDSVLAQTYKDYEIIIVDDGSTDETPLLLRKYGEKIKYFYRPHQNQAAALNFGIRESKGEYIANIDDDDIWLPDKLKVQIPFFEKDPGLGLMGTRMDVINEAGELLSQWYKNPAIAETFEGLFEENFLGFPSTVMRKRFINEVGGFDESLQTTQDYDLYLRLAKVCKIKYIDDLLVKWRMHGHNKHKNKIQKLKDRLAVVTKPENMARLSPMERRIRIGKEYYYHAEGFQNIKRWGLASKTYLRSVLICPWIGRYYWPSDQNKINTSLPYRILRIYWRIIYYFWMDLFIKNGN